jgi:hypothetical protein
MLPRLFFGTVFTVSLFLGTVNSLAEETSCDPTDVIRVIPLANLEDVEVSRQHGDRSLIWLTVDATADTTDIADTLLDHGNVRASAIQVLVEGSDCSVIVDSIRVRNGDRIRDLRIAGDSVFSSGYITNRFTVESLEIGLDLFLLQRTFCNIKVNALIYAGSNPYLRSYPFPDPKC